ncbi:MAG: class I SAM-dependent methyltransferase [Chloroflexota bacterium]|nr:class I SAM-dependent methyltransferase [Chloroflexota bacterium]
MNDIKDDIQRFDRWSDTYEDSWLQERFFDRVHQSVLALMANEARPKTILDVGCGTGRLLRKARERWPDAQLLGVDPADGMVEVAHQLNPDATFLQGTAEALPLPDESVDLAFSTVSFHHWQNHAAGLCEIARVLQPQGRFILADVCPPTWIVPLMQHRAYDRKSLRTLFVASGLRVIAQKPIYSRFVVATIGSR